MSTSTAPSTAPNPVPRLPSAADLPNVGNTAIYGLSPAQAARIYCLRSVRDMIVSSGKLDASDDPSVLVALAQYIETGHDPVDKTEARR